LANDLSWTQQVVHGTGTHTVPAVVLPVHPPKYQFGVGLPMPQLVQLQVLPNESKPVGLHTRIGVLAPQSVPAVSDTEQLVEVPLKRSKSSVQ
jgi:hypothetical protein